MQITAETIDNGASPTNEAHLIQSLTLILERLGKTSCVAGECSYRGTKKQTR
jgi:hypothetical protein